LGDGRVGEEKKKPVCNHCHETLTKAEITLGIVVCGNCTGQLWKVIAVIEKEKK